MYNAVKVNGNLNNAKYNYLLYSNIHKKSVSRFKDQNLIPITQ